MFLDIIAPMLAGLIIFLFGLKIMETALNKWAGPYLHHVIGRFTDTPLRGMLTGTAVTALLQSSSAVTVITIGLVNAGVMTFPRTLGIILGTNIGTCITTELIGLNLTQLAIPLLIVSASLWMLSFTIKEQSLKSAKFASLLTAWRMLSLAIAGFSCILVGMIVMQTIVPALQSLGLLGWFVEHAQRSILWGVFAGMCLTAAIHSGAATIAMTMGLAAVDAIPVELAIAIVIGANVGTCATAFLAGLGSNRFGQAVAWAHITLNVVGALAFLPLIGVLTEVSGAISANPSEQIAHAQTIFNIVCSVVALPFCYLPILRNIGRERTA
jgi:phosphate:Na+ symporter